jgi:hypothetical protein
MAANTASLVTNFNVSPYFDDYDETKNFHRVLFKPGLAVQTRELTQMQTIMQEQVDRFGKHVFVEGSRVAGGEFNIDDNYYYVKMPDNYANGTSITISDFSDNVLRGTTSNVTALVVGTADGTEAETNTKTLFVKYLSSWANNQFFTPGETVTSTTNAVLTSNTLVGLASIGAGTNFTINEGILFAKGNFIRFDTQSVVLSRYSDTPTAIVGFLVDETIVDSDTDTTLLDNASGSFNFSAPGADRLKLTATLRSFANTSVMSTAQQQNFVQLLDVDTGIINAKNEQTQYNEIRDYVASRTKDFFGDTIIRGMGIRLRDHLDDGTNNGMYLASQNGNNNKLAVGVDPGKAYVEGYDIELFDSTHIPLDKGINFENVEQSPISANYGNFVNVVEVSGNWNPTNGTVVKLYSQSQRSISNATYSGGTPSGTEIGQARFKTLQHDTGNPGANTCQYRVYLTDINLTADTFADVRSVFLSNATTANGYADVALTGGIAQLEETNFNRSIFTIPSVAVRSIRDASDNIDTTYTFAKRFGVSISTAGQFTINTGDGSEVFIGSGLQNGSEKDEKFVLSLDAPAFATVTGTVNISGTAVTGNNTAFNTEFVAGQKIFVADTAEVRSIQSVANSTSMTLSASATSATNSIFNKYLATGEIIDLAANGTDGTGRTVNITTSTAAAFDIQETLSSTTAASVYSILNKTDAREIAKTINKNQYVKLNLNTHPANTVGPWNLGVCDTFRINSVKVKYGSNFANTTEGTTVTSNFRLDNGQRDNFYDQARLLLKTDSTVTLNSSAYLLVNLDYFTHDFSQGSGYFSVDSYPINDANAASLTTIQTEEIPRFTSPVSGLIYDLRNSIDTRPSKAYTANTSSVALATTNPATSNTYNSGVGGLRTPKANESFTIDYSYYLARQDILTLDKKGIFSIIRGVPSLNPEPPRLSTNAMKLATIRVAPYPSLTSYRAAEISRPDYKCSVIVDKQKRYNAKDLSTLEQRVTNLEYYVALNQLERQAVDQSIVDSSGLDRFKNGIFTDPFLSHKLGDYTDEDYKIAIDKQNKEIRPQFDVTDVKLVFNSSTNLSSFKSNTVFTLPFTDVTFANQPFATTTRNIAGLFYTFDGTMSLSPDGDYWVDTRRSPDVNVDFDSTNVPWERLVEPWQSNWSSWETVVTGATTISERQTDRVYTSLNDGDIVPGYTYTSVDVYSTTTSLQQRQRSVLDVDTRVQTRNFGDRVVDVSLTPYLRSISIQVTAKGMKPNTVVYPFFDNENVAAYCTQTNSSFAITGTRGGTLTTDSSGEIYLLFTIPNDSSKRFRVGERLFTLTDSINNSDVPGLYTTRAISQFNGSGIQQTVEGTIVSTRVPFITTKSETQSRTSSDTRYLGRRLVVTPSSTGEVPTDFSSRPYYNVNFISNAGYNKIVSYYGSPGTTLGDAIDKLKSDTEFNRKISNSDDHSLVYSWVVALSELLVTGSASYDTLNKFQEDFNTLTGQSVDATKGRSYYQSLGIDPVLQTFAINAAAETPGIYVTKVDLYFATKDTAYGVEVQIREIEQGTGLPTNKIVPNSIKNIAPAAINTSTTGATATTITFDAPIYLLNGVTYGLVIKPLGNNNNTTVWVSRLGETDLITGQRVNQQPYIGTLFASSNDNIYNAIQEEDIKFTLYRAEFTLNTVGELIVANEHQEYITATNQSGTFIVGETLTGNNSSSTGLLKEIYTDADDVTRLVLTSTSGAFNTNDTLTGSQSSATTDISTIYDLDLHVAHNELTMVMPAGTNVNTAIRTTSNNNVVSTTYSTVNNTRDVAFLSERKVASRATEINSLSSAKSYRVRSVAGTTNSYVSPIIDLSRSFVTVIGNKLNNSTTNEDGKLGGSAQARYISKIITLADGQDAEDLQVYLDEYRPSTSTISVYAKLLNGDDTETFDDKTWIQLTQDSKTIFSDIDNKEDFYEANYTLPTSVLTGAGGEVQYTNISGVTFTGYKYFAIKIVMTGTNAATPPRVRNLRAIALQI